MSAADLWTTALRAGAPAAERFRSGLADVEGVQRALLARLVGLGRESRFGRAHGFAGIADVAGYQRRVPICDYTDFAPYLDRAMAGAEDELFCEPILFVEQTGGSTGGSKVVPYGEAALAGFVDALVPWIADLAERRPAVARGRAYFALSPSGRTGEERVGVRRLGSPHGFAFFGASGDALRGLSVVPMSLGAMTDFAAWQETTCLHLLAAPDLSFMSVWSPTYATELLRAIARNADRLVGLLEAAAREGGPLAVAAERPREVARALASAVPDTERLWPMLDTLSCWTDASSAPFARELQAMFPRVHIQPKGLMSTEAAVSFAWGEGEGGVLAHSSAFLEFVDAAGEPRLAWQLETGATYRVLVSTFSGFYRYDTKDMVEVVGWTAGAPRLRFLGRAGLSADLCGEKLTEEFVLKCLGPVAGASYAVLVAARAPRPHYRLYLEGEALAEALADRASALDAALGANPQYAYARRLGQLGPVVPRAVPSLFRQVRDHLLGSGRGLAGMKAPALVAEKVGADLAERLDRFS